MRILLAIDGSPHPQVAVDEVARRPLPETIGVIWVVQPYTPPEMLDGIAPGELPSS
jgi:hypothetical protein